MHKQRPSKARSKSCTRKLNLQRHYKETEKKVADSITSIQNIAAAQIASLNKELVEMQVRSRQFSQKYEGAENERIWFFYELHKYQMDSTHECEQRQAKHIKEFEKPTSL